MLNSRYTIRLLCVLSGIVLLMMSCREEVNTSHGVLRIVEKKQPDRLQPYIARSSTARVIQDLIFQPLLRTQATDLTTTPVLLADRPKMFTALRDSLETSRRIDMRLRPDARWPDGRRVTNRDVLFSYQCLFNPYAPTTSIRNNLSLIRGAELHPLDSSVIYVYVDTTTSLAIERVSAVQILPVHHYDSLGLLETISLNAIIDGRTSEDENEALEHFAEQYKGQKYDRTVMGSGPYELVRWVSDYEIVLRRKANWWGLKHSNMDEFKANPEEIHYRFIADEQLAIQAIETGQVDLVADVHPTKFDAMRHGRPDDYHYASPMTPRYVYLILNHASSVLKDKNIRKALAHSINTQEIIDAILQSYGQGITGPFSPNAPWYDTSVKPYTRDTAMVRHFIEAASYAKNDEGQYTKVVAGQPETLKLRLHITGSATSRKVALILKERLSQVSIPLESVTQRFNPNTIEDMEKGQFDMVLGLRSFTNLPTTIRSNWHTVDGPDMGGNYGRFSHPRVDSLIDVIESTTDLQRIPPMVHALHRQLHEEVAVLYLWAPQERLLVHKLWTPALSDERPGYKAHMFEINAEE